MKELRLTLRVRNNRLIRAREALGLSCPKAAERIGVSYGHLIEYEGLHLSPLGTKGGWKPSAKRIATFYGGSVEFYWPDAVMAVVEPIRTVEADAMDVAKLVAPTVLRALPSESDPEEELDQARNVRRVREALVRLGTENPRVAEVVRQYFGTDNDEPRSLEEISIGLARLKVGTHTAEVEGVGLSRGRAQMLKEEGLARMRRYIEEQEKIADRARRARRT